MCGTVVTNVIAANTLRNARCIARTVWNVREAFVDFAIHVAEDTVSLVIVGPKRTYSARVDAIAGYVVNVVQRRFMCGRFARIVTKARVMKDFATVIKFEVRAHTPMIIAFAGYAPLCGNAVIHTHLHVRCLDAPLLARWNAS